MQPNSGTQRDKGSPAPKSIKYILKASLIHQGRIGKGAEREQEGLEREQMISREAAEN
jgi:hypothetical protein